jgi:hypothetical protein
MVVVEGEFFRVTDMSLKYNLDLYSTNSYVGIIDEDGRKLWKKKLVTILPEVFVPVDSLVQHGVYRLC